MAYRLVVQRGEPPGGVFDLRDGDNLVGRSRKRCNIVLGTNAADVSGEHLLIFVAGDHVEVENLGRNGSRLNGEPLAGRTVIHADQRLTLAASVELWFERISAPAGAPPVPASPAALSAVMELEETPGRLLSERTPSVPPPPVTPPPIVQPPAPPVAPPPPPPVPPTPARAGGRIEDEWLDSRADAVPSHVSTARGVPAAPTPAAASDRLGDADEHEMDSGFLQIAAPPAAGKGGAPPSAPPSSVLGLGDIKLGSHVSDVRDSVGAIDDELFKSLRAEVEAAGPALDDAAQKTRGISPEVIEYMRRRQQRKERLIMLAVGSGVLLLLGGLAWLLFGR